jgi:hypothetical protein
MTPSRIAGLVPFALLLTFATAFAVPVRDLARVRLAPGVTRETLEAAGLDVVSDRGAGTADVLLRPGDLRVLERLGATARILVPDMGRVEAERAQAEIARSAPRPSAHVLSATRPDGVYRTESLPPFGSGSMGGYWTDAEIKMKLDQMVANDVHGVVADKIDTLGYSIAGRPIWGLRLGAPSGKPVVFMNALTHAREPESMQTLLYFADDLLSRYATDPFATYLLNQRTLYLVPLVNPDGYAYNQQVYADSGWFAYWRKNIRDNDNDGHFDDPGDGVDINRNYGYQWGFDNGGSSPFPINDTYRGTAAFSEPETRAQRDLVNQIKPTIAISIHTFGDQFVHPWGYQIVATPDSTLFKEWDDELTEGSSYMAGPGVRTLYATNGDFNDWCYGDVSQRPKTFGWTPEIGNENDFFFPPPSRILPLALENLRSCYVATAIAGPWVQQDGIAIDEGALNAGYGAGITVRARNAGAVATPGPIAGTLVPLDPGVRIVLGTVAYPALASRQSANPLGSFHVAIDDTVTPGRLVRFEVDFTAASGFFSRDTIAIPLGTPTVVAFDDASSGLGKWFSTGWGIVTNDPTHPSRYFADSPSGNYGDLVDTGLQLNGTINLSHGVHAYAEFEARWLIEADWDGATLETSRNGIDWFPQSGTGTSPGAGTTEQGSIQTLGTPYFDGARYQWKPHRVDLSQFTGSTATAVRLRFRLQSDGAVDYEGFNFDSLRILLYDPAAQPSLVAVGDGRPPLAFAFDAPAPNPARDRVRFGFALPRSGAVRLEIMDLQGRTVRTLAQTSLAPGRYERAWDVRDDHGRRVPPGMYLARLRGASGVALRRIAVLD